MPIFARSMFTSTPGSRMLRPRYRIAPSARWPGYRSYMRFKVRSRVDLPQPDGPMNAVTCLRSEEHTSELQSQFHLVCLLLLEKKKSRLPQNDALDPALTARLALSLKAGELHPRRKFLPPYLRQLIADRRNLATASLKQPHETA